MPFCDLVNVTGLLKKASTRPPGDQTKQTVVSPTNGEGLPWFTCPEQGCIKTFRTNKPFRDTWTLAAMRLNSRKSHNMTRSDTNGPSIALSLKPQNPSCASTASSSFGVTEENVLSMGWAQTKSKRRSRFSVKVKNYLLEQFMIGEETGRKVTPGEASARMRTVRTEEGAQIFGKDEWLTP